MYLISRLTGKALNSVSDLIAGGGEETLDDFKSFISQFRLLNQPDHSREEAAVKIRNIKQEGRTVIEYSREFQKYASIFKYDQAALMDHFRAGLNRQVRAGLVGQRVAGVSTLSALIEQAKNVDAELLQLSMEDLALGPANPSSQAPRPQARQPTVHQPNAPAFVDDPMDVDRVRIGQPHPPVDAAERRRRQEQGLCYYCGGTGHQTADCPIRRRGRKPGNFRARSN